jgi:hypothetical protein
MRKYLLSCFAMSLAHLSAVAFVPVSVFPDGDNEYMAVNRPGHYCVEKDAHHTDVFDSHSFSKKDFSGRPLLTLLGPRRASDLPGAAYTIDFCGHTLSAATMNMAGISADGELTNVRVANGKIVIPGIKTGNIGIFLELPVEGFALPGVAMLGGPWNPSYEDVRYTELANRRKPRYSTTKYVVEHMDIRAGYRGIVLGGGNNVIRNSRIEVDGNTAIYVYGPGTIIENNTIIVHGKGERKQWDAAIKLRDADNAIVRNNRIEFDGGLLSKGEAAINLLDSDNVTIDGNTVTGHRKTVRVNGVSTFTEINTKSSR